MKTQDRSAGWVPLSSTPPPSVQHINSTQGPLLSSPKNPSVQHKCVCSSKKRQFNTNASVQHKCVSSTPKNNRCVLIRAPNMLANNGTYHTFCYFIQHSLSERTKSVLNWRFCVELTHFGGKNGVALVCWTDGRVKVRVYLDGSNMNKTFYMVFRF